MVGVQYYAAAACVSTQTRKSPVRELDGSVRGRVPVRERVSSHLCTVLSSQIFLRSSQILHFLVFWRHPSGYTVHSGLLYINQYYYFNTTDIITFDPLAVAAAVAVAAVVTAVAAGA